VAVDSEPRLGREPVRLGSPHRGARVAAEHRAADDGLKLTQRGIAYPWRRDQRGGDQRSAAAASSTRCWLGNVGVPLDQQGIAPNRVRACA
jgi:hypothetical protein